MSQRKVKVHNLFFGCAAWFIGLALIILFTGKQYVTPLVCVNLGIALLLTAIGAVARDEDSNNKVKSTLDDHK